MKEHYCKMYDLVDISSDPSKVKCKICDKEYDNPKLGDIINK